MASNNPFPVFCVTCRQSMDESEQICPNCGQDQRPGAPNIYKEKLRQQAASQALLRAQQAQQAKVDASALTSTDPFRPAGARAKSKSTAITLAALFGFFAWIYTFKYDSSKFWFGLVLSTVSCGLLSIVFGIWALIDASSRPEHFYTNYVG